MSDARETDRGENPAAVVFDVGRVLYHWNLRHLFAQLIDDEEELEWFLANVVTEQWHHRHDEGTPLAQMVPQRIAEFPRHADLIRAYAENFNRTIPGPVVGTHELARRVKARGVPLFALTNFGVEFWNGFVPTAPIFELFDDIVVSGEVQCAKPDPAIYAIAEERFGLPPEQLFFIDDKPENIAAARARGWHGHVFTDADALEVELVRLGLLD